LRTTSFLEPSSKLSVQKTVYGKDIQFRLASVASVDTKQNNLFLSDDGELQYDLPVLAAGTETIFFRKRKYIHVIEGSPNLLSAMSDTTHRAAIAALKQLGVHVKLNTLVTSFKDEQALLSDGSVIHAKTLLWTAGVVARTFEE